MQSMVRIAALSVVAAGATSAAASRPVSGRSADALAVETASGWVTWWRSEASPSRWDGSASLATSIAWQRGIPGLEWGEFRLRGASEAWRTRVVVVRLDPQRVALSLAPAFTRDESWSAAEADTGVSLALDAGQFRGSLPYGWVVSQRREILRPEYAPLAGAVVVSESGAVRVVAPDSITAERANGSAREAFQSYPLLLLDGEVPAALREAGKGVDLRHRDSRLALGTLADGRVVIALTRFDALGRTLGRIPFGLTTPEMAAVMGALGCRDALMLDGGISGQLLVRDVEGATHSWPGLRRVPMGLVGRRR